MVNPGLSEWRIRVAGHHPGAREQSRRRGRGAPPVATASECGMSLPRSSTASASVSCIPAEGLSWRPQSARAVCADCTPRTYAKPCQPSASCAGSTLKPSAPRGRALDIHRPDHISHRRRCRGKAAAGPEVRDPLLRVSVRTPSVSRTKGRSSSCLPLPSRRCGRRKSCPWPRRSRCPGWSCRPPGPCAAHR